ncbi:MauE/DoxX family redox-associated membrane protein [Mucilaginibacter agri]|uniref:Methylamine utilisation protein MauE domain-containing protein n=1 Tax=Mucilaginibacter agri TaxID=2695265 RepID=A0A965ZF25_9SPHI|nr:MauE/DoxX family redox-associated membrane protein [Mucilaginibacter agri]NCD68582.1 hypothetical protein [Mucilaginibacter agri]
MKKNILKELCAAFIVLLFTYTALSKLLDMNRFVSTMRVSPFPYINIFAPVLGWIIPVIELLIAGFMITSKYQRTGFIGSIILLCLFEIYIGSLLISGLHLPCSCGGVISKLSWKQHLIFNLFFIVISIIPLILDNYKNRSFGITETT